MIPIRHAQRPVVLESIAWQWLAAVLAMILLLLMARALSGAESRAAPPRLIPAIEDQWLSATEAYRQRDWQRADVLLLGLERGLRETPRASPRVDRAAAVQRAVAVWAALVAHARGQPEVALDRWLAAPLPPETAVWRDVARAAALLETGRLEAAGAVLAAAEENAPGNAVVSYYAGLLELERAARWRDWPDPRPETRLVSTAAEVAEGTSRAAEPRSAERELAATAALERALVSAACVDPNEPLLPADWPLETRFVPSVGDLLLALGAEQFESAAHLTLAQLFLERGNLDVAEEHFDAARELGAQIVFGYADLTDAYEQGGRHADAARTGIKALAFGPRRPGDGLRLLENVRRGLGELWVP